MTQVLTIVEAQPQKAYFPINEYLNNVLLHCKQFKHWAKYHDMHIQLNDLKQIAVSLGVKPSKTLCLVNNMHINNLRLISHSKPVVTSTDNITFIMDCTGVFSGLEQHYILCNRIWSGTLLYPDIILNKLNTALEPYLPLFAAVWNKRTTYEAVLLLREWWHHSITQKNCVKVKEIAIPEYNVTNAVGFGLFREGVVNFIIYCNDVLTVLLHTLTLEEFSTVMKQVNPLIQSMIQNLNQVSQTFLPPSIQ